MRARLEVMSRAIEPEVMGRVLKPEVMGWSTGSDGPCARAGNLMISDMKMPPEKAVPDYATLMDDMYSLLDAEVDSLSKPWKGSLPFECYIIEDKTTICEQTFLEPPQLVEICDYLEGQMYPVQRLCFCPRTYPPPKSNDEMKGSDKTNKCVGWNKLRRDLQIKAHDRGNPISFIGHDGRGDCRRMICANSGRKHRAGKGIAPTAANPYRKTSLVNNHKNNRTGGKGGPGMPRRIKTSNTSSKEKPNCHWRAALKWDEFSFFIELERRSGNPMHEGHPRILEPGAMPFPVRYLTDDQIDDARQVVTSTSNKATGRNFAFGKWGRFINSVKMAYIANRDRRQEEGDTVKDDITRMIDDLEQSDEIAFTSLSDVPVEDLTPNLMDPRMANDQKVLKKKR